MRSPEDGERSPAGSPRPSGPTRRAVLGGLAASGLLACERLDATSWVTRERFDVDRRFRDSLEVLVPPPAPPLEAGRPWSFLVISDLHSFGEPPRTLEEVGRYLEREPVDAVFCLGDIADAGWPRELEAGRIALESLPAPVFVAIGNHDVYNEGWAPFRDLFGSSVYELRVAGSVLIVLDSAGATLGGLQRPWLEERLEAARGAEHVFVLTHYPLWTGRLPLGDLMGEQEEVYDLLDLFRSHGVEAHLSGHTHRWAHTRVGGLRLYTVSALREEAGSRTALRVEVEGEAVRYVMVELGG